jgi:hypothetical protein
MSEYETKDSGKRVEFETGMVRDTQEGKPRFDLIIPEGLPYHETMMYRRAQLMARGAAKYDDRNWEKARTPEELARFKASAFRHFMEWYCDETDEDYAAATQYNMDGAEYVKWRLRQTPDLDQNQSYYRLEPELMQNTDTYQELLGRIAADRTRLSFQDVLDSERSQDRAWETDKEILDSISRGISGPVTPVTDEDWTATEDECACDLCYGESHDD